MFTRGYGLFTQFYTDFGSAGLPTTLPPACVADGARTHARYACHACPTDNVWLDGHTRGCRVEHTHTCRLLPPLRITWFLFPLPLPLRFAGSFTGLRFFPARLRALRTASCRGWFHTVPVTVTAVPLYLRFWFTCAAVGLPTRLVFTPVPHWFRWDVTLCGLRGALHPVTPLRFSQLPYRLPDWIRLPVAGLDAVDLPRLPLHTPAWLPLVGSGSATFTAYGRCPLHTAPGWFAPYGLVRYVPFAGTRRSPNCPVARTQPYLTRFYLLCTPCPQRFLPYLQHLHTCTLPAAVTHGTHIAATVNIYPVARITPHTALELPVTYLPDTRVTCLLHYHTCCGILPRLYLPLLHCGIPPPVPCLPPAGFYYGYRIVTPPHRDTRQLVLYHTLRTLLRLLLPGF